MELPYQHYVAESSEAILKATEAAAAGGAADEEKTVSSNVFSRTSGMLQLRASVFVYAVALLSTLGWVCFVIFGGIGLAALPMDHMEAWIHRPRALSLETYAAARQHLAEATRRLLDAGQRLREASASTQKKRSWKKKVSRLRGDVQKVEDAHKALEVAYKERGGSPLVAGLHLGVGILCAVLSLLWVLHIVLHNLTRLHSFLNVVFVQLDSVFSLLGLGAYAIMSFYLLWAVVRGIFRVGVRLPFLSVYPMKLGDTLMNAFLFNTLIILLCSVTLSQFCAYSFREYAANTAADTMFSVYVIHIRGIGHIMRFMPYLLLGFLALGIVYSLLFPSLTRDRHKR